MEKYIGSRPKVIPLVKLAIRQIPTLIQERFIITSIYRGLSTERIDFLLHQIKITGARLISVTKGLIPPSLTSAATPLYNVSSKTLSKIWVKESIKTTLTKANTIVTTTRLLKGFPCTTKAIIINSNAVV